MALMVSGAAAVAESTAFVEGATGPALLLHAASPAMVSKVKKIGFMRSVISSGSKAAAALP